MEIKSVRAAWLEVVELVCARIYVKDVVSLGVETGKAELRRGKYRVVLPDKTYSGEICVAATFTHSV
ncbi:hypothetical protein FH972_017369 [Carpinus fangiana]|uniref:Uncharacterized protein n=1 Tax=Carpinus fangiana TaxID=176857 RepID=A0A5N6RIR6_9ROSI|nr:hypothetical protein FH972_017369 [Carpinus fangiana]